MIFLRVPDYHKKSFPVRYAGAGSIFMSGQKNGKHRDAIRIGLCVDVIQKTDQQSGKLTRGRVKEILTNSLMHPHGIKVRLKDGRVGRVAAIIDGKDGTKNGAT
jgi:uncharacterized repeat protein (TIGR03833 family)